MPDKGAPCPGVSAIRNNRSKDVALSLHFFGDAQPGRAHTALTAIVVAVFAMTKRICATAEESTGHKEEGKTKDHEVCRLEFETLGLCRKGNKPCDHSSPLDLCKHQE